MTSIIEYWREISITIGGVVSFVVGRKSSKFLEKQQQTDAISAMQETYNLFLVHYKEQYEKVAKQVDKLQNQFIELQLSYVKEIENSQNWEKLHRELEKQYRDLEGKYDGLEKLYEKLKADFERHKKMVK